MLFNVPLGDKSYTSLSKEIHCRLTDYLHILMCRQQRCNLRNNKYNSTEYNIEKNIYIRMILQVLNSLPLRPEQEIIKDCDVFQ